MKLQSLCFALLLAGAAASAQADTAYYVVVPVAKPVIAEPSPVLNISVKLRSAALPDAKVNREYNHDLNGYITVTGDPAYDPARLHWSLSSGTLPAGLTLDPAGKLVGTPTAPYGGAPFELVASYRRKSGVGTFTIKVGEAVLDVKQVVAGRAHTCAVTLSGGAVCWGRNASGQLGDGTQNPSLTPVPVVGLGSGVASLTAGDQYTCAVTTSGAAKCWGSNENGQLGDGTVTQRLTPITVTGLGSGVLALAAGLNHTCAVTVSGAACWGSNSTGQLGDGTTTVRLTPRSVSGLGMGSGVKAIAAAKGSSHTCAVTTAGAAKCWGYNGNGQLGDGTRIDSLTPVTVSGLGSGVVSVAMGMYHACALTSAGGVACWGGNGNGQLGDGTQTQRFAPVPVIGMGSGVATLAAGNSHSCVVTTAGAAMCWGYNGNGQLGDGTTTQRLTPVNVAELDSGVTGIGVGHIHTCAQQQAGGLKCWGSNTAGQLGEGSTAQQLAPATVKP